MSPMGFSVSFGNSELIGFSVSFGISEGDYLWGSDLDPPAASVTPKFCQAWRGSELRWPGWV